jgi:hypothetical protein
MPPEILEPDTRPGSRVSDVAFVPVALPADRSATIDVGIGDVVVRVGEESDVERVARLVVAIARGSAC